MDDSAPGGAPAGGSAPASAATSVSTVGNVHSAKPLGDDKKRKKADESDSDPEPKKLHQRLDDWNLEDGEPNHTAMRVWGREF